MLNGRVGNNNDFTRVSSKGQSVVDYCIVSYENLHLFQDFKVVRATDLITKTGLNMTGLDVRSIPDHSLLYCELHISPSLSSLDTSHASKTEFIKYDVKNMPDGFCYSDKIVDRDTETINSLESHEVSQLNINKVYDNFCSIVGEEMKQKLKSKVIVISNSINMNKKKRIKKPWWNDNLTYLFNDMCYTEKIWKKGKLIRSSCQNLKSNFISKRRILTQKLKKPNVSIGTVYNSNF